MVLNEIFNPGQGEWLDQHALSGVSALTGKVVRAGRVHVQPRTTFYECGSHKKANRLSVMFSESGKRQFVDEDASRRGAETKSLPTAWVGATFFYHDRPLGDETHEVYVDTLDGLCELHLTKDEISDVRAVYGEWSRPWTVYELVLKKSVKELDPRRFNPLERKKFDESDNAEWA